MLLHVDEDAVGGAGRFSPWSWLKALGFGFLTFNSAMAIYRSNADKAAVTFVAISSIALLLLFFCLECYENERAPTGSPSRERLLVAIWCLTTLLTAMCSYKIAGVGTRLMPLLMQILLCLMVGVVIQLGRFCSFLSHRGQTDAVSASFREGSRIRLRIKLHGVLAALRQRLSPRRGAGIAHNPRDVAWSVARLILDSGASTHAVGNIWLLEGFQAYNPPLSATLADGRNLRILGIGHIERENYIIPNVQLVEGLQDGLISVRQLDRQHGLISCFGNGICRIMLADGTEVGGAFVQDDDCLYLLRYLEVPEPSQE